MVKSRGVKRVICVLVVALLAPLLWLAGPGRGG
jgi:hypothetical protein